MNGWVKDPERKRLNRLETDLENKSESESEIEDKKVGEA